jgi:DNA adenine methylase
MRYYSPLRYPGGKGKLAQLIHLIVEDNGLIDGSYVELYAGGAGVALSLIINEYVSTVIINDLNRSVYAFWFSVLNDTEALCRLIFDTPVTLDEWAKQRIIQENVENEPLLSLGFSTFFMNRTNRSGIIKGGLIGGKFQTGVWKLDARFNKKDLISRIEKIAKYRDRIRLYNMDASKFILTILPNLTNKSLVYLDPPYFNKGPELYQNNYKEEDHYNLSALICNNINQHWIITYDNTPEIVELYKEFQQITYSLSYSAAKRYRGSEVMIFSPTLTIPVFAKHEAVGSVIIS